MNDLLANFVSNLRGTMMNEFNEEWGIEVHFDTPLQEIREKIRGKGNPVLWLRAHHIIGMCDVMSALLHRVELDLDVETDRALSFDMGWVEELGNMLREAMGFSPNHFKDILRVM